jgi:hypothetical protein
LDVWFDAEDVLPVVLLVVLLVALPVDLFALLDVWFDAEDVDVEEDLPNVRQAIAWLDSLDPVRILNDFVAFPKVFLFF